MMYFSVSKQGDASFKTADVTVNEVASRNNEITYVILGAVAFVGIVTTVIFIVRKSWLRYIRNRCESSNYQTELSDLPINGICISLNIFSKYFLKHLINLELIHEH